MKNLLLVLLIAVASITSVNASEMKTVTINRPANIDNRESVVMVIVNGRMFKTPLVNGQNLTFTVPTNEVLNIQYATIVPHNIGTRFSTESNEAVIKSGTVLEVTDDTIVTVSPNINGFSFN